MSTVYENIKALADQQEISICKLEQQAGIGNGVISAWKTSVPRLDKLLNVARVLGVKISDLIEE